MQGVKRRVVYVGLYELIAIILSAILLELMSGGGASSVGIAVVASALAIVWNLVFNYGFEYWEKHRQTKGRSLGVRVLHALGFEGGLALFLLPIIALWLNVSIMEALMLEAGLLIFFLVYTFVFNWVFDAVFGLPAAAMG